MATIANTEQRSLDWYRTRLGKITGSKAGDLIGKGRSKDDIFTKTGLAYLNSVAAERMLAPEIVEDDEMFQVYLDEVNVTSKAMRIGTEREDEARLMYELKKGINVIEASSVQHSILKSFASSPDGVIPDAGGEIDGCIEIKCPNPTTHFDYLVNVKDAESLKKTNATYYWQCISHMAVTGARYCDFITYSPYSSIPVNIVRIERDPEAIALLEERIAEGEKHIQSLVSALPQ